VALPSTKKRILVHHSCTEKVLKYFVFWLHHSDFEVCDWVPGDGIESQETIFMLWSLVEGNGVQKLKDAIMEALFDIWRQWGDEEPSVESTTSTFKYSRKGSSLRTAIVSQVMNDDTRGRNGDFLLEEHGTIRDFFYQYYVMKKESQNMRFGPTHHPVEARWELIEYAKKKLDEGHGMAGIARTVGKAKQMRETNKKAVQRAPCSRVLAVLLGIPQQPWRNSEPIKI
jgi:hypothetical protein